MSERAIRHQTSKRGSALISSLIVFVGLLGIVSASLAVSTVEMKESRRAVDEVRSKYFADAGMERGLHFLADVVKKNSFDPLPTLNGLFATSSTISPFIGQPVLAASRSAGFR